MDGSRPNAPIAPRGAGRRTDLTAGPTIYGWNERPPQHASLSPPSEGASAGGLRQQLRADRRRHKSPWWPKPRQSSAHEAGDGLCHRRSNQWCGRFGFRAHANGSAGTSRSEPVACSTHGRGGWCRRSGLTTRFEIGTRDSTLCVAGGSSRGCIMNREVLSRAPVPATTSLLRAQARRDDEGVPAKGLDRRRAGWWAWRGKGVDGATALEGGGGRRRPADRVLKRGRRADDRRAVGQDRRRAARLARERVEQASSTHRNLVDRRRTRRNSRPARGLCYRHAELIGAAAARARRMLSLRTPGHVSGSSSWGQRRAAADQQTLASSPPARRVAGRVRGTGSSSRRATHGFCAGGLRPTIDRASRRGGAGGRAQELTNVPPIAAHLVGRALARI